MGMVSASNSVLGRWVRAGTKVNANAAVHRMRQAARLKALHRTPYPMVLARIKVRTLTLNPDHGANTHQGENPDPEPRP